MGDYFYLTANVNNIFDKRYVDKNSKNALNHYNGRNKILKVVYNKLDKKKTLKEKD